MSGIIGNPSAKSGIIGLQTPVSLPWFRGTCNDADGPSNNDAARTWVPNPAYSGYVDTASWWDSGNARYIPKIKGLYFCLVVATMSDDSNVGHWYIQKNDAVRAVGYKEGTSEAYQQVSCTCVIDMDGGSDYIDFVVTGRISAAQWWNLCTIYLIQ